MDTYTTSLQTLTISVDALFLSHVESTQGQLQLRTKPHPLNFKCQIFGW